MCLFFYSFARVLKLFARAAPARSCSFRDQENVRIRSKSLSRAPLPRLTPVLNQFDQLRAGQLEMKTRAFAVWRWKANRRRQLTEESRLLVEMMKQFEV